MGLLYKGSRYKDLMEVLMWTSGNWENTELPDDFKDTLHEGLVFRIMISIHNLIDYECHLCNTLVKNSRRGRNIIMCHRCGIGACIKCTISEGVSYYLCRVCKYNIRELNNFPTQYHNKSAKNKKDRKDKGKDKYKDKEKDREKQKEK